MAPSFIGLRSALPIDEASAAGSTFRREHDFSPRNDDVQREGRHYRPLSREMASLDARADREVQRHHQYHAYTHEGWNYAAQSHHPVPASYPHISHKTTRLPAESRWSTGRPDPSLPDDSEAPSSRFFRERGSYEYEGDRVAVNAYNASTSAHLTPYGYDSHFRPRFADRGSAQSSVPRPMTSTSSRTILPPPSHLPSARRFGDSPPFLDDPNTSRDSRYHDNCMQYDASERGNRSTSSPDAGSKRFRISRACQHCKTRKTRCDAIGVLARRALPAEQNARQPQPSPSDQAQRRDQSSSSALVKTEDGMAEESETRSANAPDMIVVQPCTNCVRASIDCVYSRKQLKRGPSKGYVKQLEKRLDSLEHNLLGRGALTDEAQSCSSSSGPSIRPQSIGDDTKARPEERLANLESILKSAPRAQDMESRVKQGANSDVETEHSAAETSKIPPYLAQHMYSVTHEGFNIVLRPFFDTQLHRTLPLLEKDSRTSSDKVDITTQRAAMLLLEPLTSSVSSLEKHRSVFHSVVGEALTVTPVPNRLHTSHSANYKVTSPIVLLDQKRDQLSSRESAQADALMLCYLDSLRLGSPSTELLGAAARLLNPVTQSHRAKHLVDLPVHDLQRQSLSLMVLDRWHSLSFALPHSFMLEPESTTTLLRTAIRVDTSSRGTQGEQTIRIELLRSSLMLDLYSQEMDAVRGDARRLSHSVLVDILRRAELDEGSDDDAEASFNQADASKRLAVRSALRCALEAHHRLLSLPRTSEGKLTAERIKVTLRPSIDLLAHLHGKGTSNLSVLLHSCLAPSLLAIVVSALGWGVLALSCLDKEDKGMKPGAYEHQISQAHSIDELSDQILQSTTLLLELALDSQRFADSSETDSQESSSRLLETKTCSLAPVYSRIAVYGQYWVELLCSRSDQDQPAPEKNESSKHFRDDGQRKFGKCDAVTELLQALGPLGLVLASTDADSAWEFWMSRSLRHAASRRSVPPGPGSESSSSDQRDSEK